MIQKTPQGWKAVSTTGAILGIFKTKREARAAEFEAKAKEVQRKMEMRNRA